MNFCNKCGEKIEENAKFCLKCGNKIEQGTKKEQVVEKEEEKAKEQIEKIEEEKVTEQLAEIEEIEQVNIPTKIKEEIGISEIIKKQHKKVKTKTVIISVIIILIITFTGSVLFFSKDNIFYNYYCNKALKEDAISIKVCTYNDALAHKYNADIMDRLYEILKNDSDFIEEISKATNLKEEDKNSLISKICTYKADQNFNHGNYENALKSLNIATKYGYDIKNYINYSDLMEKLKKNNSTNDVKKVTSTYTFENKNPTDLESNIYKYSGDYIEQFSNVEYLKEKNLRKYDKETLALIRNEIFARHGYVFSTEVYKKYFNSKYWYSPNPSFKGGDSELNKYEIENVKLILKIEESLN